MTNGCLLPSQYPANPALGGSYKTAVNLGEISTNFFTDRHGHTLTSMIIRDISDRKKQEPALLIANQKLNPMNIVAWHDI